MRKLALPTGYGLVLIWLSYCAAPAAAQELFAPPANPAALPADPYGHPIRFTLRHEIGRRIGYDDGMTTLGMFIPLGEIEGDSLLFCDLQPMFYNDGTFGSNLGLGFRVLGPSLDRVYGMYAYYDYRQTDFTSFNQLTLGFDSLGTVVDLRANLYLPEQDRREMPRSAVRDPHFLGHELRFGGFEYAMQGGDFEVGLVLPELRQTQSRLLGGLYHFDTQEDEDATGVRLRLETHWTSRLTTDAALYHDDLTGTTFVFGIALNWLAESHSSWRPPIQSVRRGPQRHITQHASDRLAEPTYRLPNIAVGDRTHVAVNGDRPWHFLHVVEGASGGSGTFENPFGTLEDAMAVARPENVVYTPQAGTFQPAEMLVVPESVALLSNAREHWIPTQVGDMLLPFSGASPDLAGAPIIHSSVYLSGGATLDGFRILGIGDSLDQAGMIRSQGESNITVAHNLIRSHLDGIWLQDVDSAAILDNRIESALGAGVRLQNASQSTVSGTDVVSTTGAGIQITGGGTHQVRDNRIAIEGDGSHVGGDGILASNVNQIHVTDNQIGSVGASGIQVANASGATIDGNHIANAAAAGIVVANADGATIEKNRILRTGGDGIAVSGSVGARVLENRLEHIGGHGISLNASDEAYVADNQVLNTVGDGIRAVGGAAPEISANYLQTIDGSGIAISGGAEAKVDGNLIVSAFRHGISLIDAHDASIRENHIVLAGSHGIQFLDSALPTMRDDLLLNIATATIQGNAIDEAAGDGIHIGELLQSVHFDGQIQDNTISRAQTGLWIGVSQSFAGDIAKNSSSENREFGMYFRAGSLYADQAVIDSNVFHYNGMNSGREGLSIHITGAGDSVLSVVNNELKFNNLTAGQQHGEFATRLGPGAGPLTVRMDGNTSFNHVQTGEFNFDFLNASPFDLQYELVTPNLGTIGSSDGSVPAP